MEETAGKLHGYEIKFKPKKAKTPQTWLDTYRNATFQQIDRENFLEFVL